MKDIDKMHQEYYNNSHYQRGLKDGQEYSQPSPSTLKFMEETRLSNQETRQEMKYIKEKLDKMPTREEMLLSNEKLVERIFLKANEKYAPRLVEKIVYGMVGVIILYVLNQWLSLV